METVPRMADCGSERPQDKGFPGMEKKYPALQFRQCREVYLKGMAVCCEVHPTLGTDPQNILTDGMYLVMLPVGAVRPNT